MKSIRLTNFLYIAVLLLLSGSVFLSMGCGGEYVHSASSDDYYAGKNLGYEAAKKDAVKVRCTDYTNMVTGMDRLESSKMVRYRNKHTRLLEKAHSSDFVKGFKIGYSRSFRMHLDTYCGY